jgi:hypothetical protein
MRSLIRSGIFLGICFTAWAWCQSAALAGSEPDHQTKDEYGSYNDHAAALFFSDTTAAHAETALPVAPDQLLRIEPLFRSNRESLRATMPLDEDLSAIEPLLGPEYRPVQGKLSGPWGSLSSTIDIHEAAVTDPLVDRARWKADHALRLPLCGAFYLFGEFGAHCEDAATQDVNFASRAGVGWKVPVCLGGEIQLQSGRTINYVETPHLDDTREHTELFIELAGKWPVVGPLKLEYSGSALPGLNPTEHDRINQDIHLALPFHKSSSVRIGARHSWELPTVPKPWSEGMEVYLGLSLTP